MTNYTEYKVKKGDNLYNIAKANTIGNYLLLSQYNNLKDPNKIYPGQIIRIPLNLLKSIPSTPLPESMYRPKLEKFKSREFESTKFYPILVKEVKTSKPKTPKSIKLIRSIPKPDIKILNKSDTIKLLGDYYKHSITPQQAKIVPSWRDLNYYISQETLDDIAGVLWRGNYTLKERGRMLLNGMTRRLGIAESDTKEKKRNTKMVKTAPKESVADTTVINLAQAKASYNISNDTTFFRTPTGLIDRHRFAIPRSINLAGVKLGGRNRGDRSTFESRDVIPVYRPIRSYEGNTWYAKDSEGHINEFLGYDKNGNIKLGTLDKFGPGDHLTQVFYGWITNIPRDNNGNPIPTRAVKDSRRYSPTVEGLGENKDPFRGGLLLMTPKKSEIKKTGNYGWNLFNNVVGGAYILLADNETRLVRGSINNVLDEIEKMKTNHKGKPIKFYEVDNGSYNRGMSTSNNIITGEDLSIYDTLNLMAGHYFYIKPLGFPIKRLGGVLKSKYYLK